MGATEVTPTARLQVKQFVDWQSNTLTLAVSVPMAVLCNATTRGTSVAQEWLQLRLHPPPGAKQNTSFNNDRIR